MAESRMYGTNRTSYQKIGNARLSIRHSQPINTESVTGRTQKISAIYVESPEGEKFKYPFKHLNGARAMARHVSEGGNAYDDFGKYISSLSEETVKLQKFKQYMNRSSVMAETLSMYVDTVNERITAVKKEIHNLQKEAFYRESIDNFTVTVVEDVPNDVAENWIEQLTIKQFNEELKDVFPYIYRLIGEVTKAKELGPDDIVAESDPCWKGYKQIGMKKKGGKQVPNCVPEEIQIETAFDQMMGQFGEDTVEHGDLYFKFRSKQTPGAGPEGKQSYLVGFAGFVRDPAELTYANSLRKFTALNNMMDIVNAIKKLMKDKTFVSAKQIILYYEPAMVNRYEHLKEFFNMMETYTGDKLKVEHAPEREVDPSNRGAGKKRLPKGHFAANPKDYDIPDKKMTRYFKIGNTNLMQFLKSEREDLMRKFFRPNFKGFVMNDKEYRAFLKMLNSPEIKDQYGNPQINIDQSKSFAEDHDVDEGLKSKLAMLALLGLTGYGAMQATSPKNSPLGKALYTAAQQGDQEAASHLKQLGSYVDGNDSRTLRMLKFKYLDEPQEADAPPTDSSASPLSEPSEKKIPIGEFILSYFDRESGKFPKGETAVLTAVQKEYGDKYVKPASEFVKEIESTVAAKNMEKMQQSMYPETEKIKHLAGI